MEEWHVIYWRNADLGHDWIFEFFYLLQVIDLMSNIVISLSYELKLENYIQMPTLLHLRGSN